MKEPAVVTVVLPDGKTVEETIDEPTSLKVISERHASGFRFPILGARVNNRITELSAIVDSNCTVEFLTIEQRDGKRFYIRSMFFVLIKSAKEMFPHAKLHIDYSIGNGYYCYFEGLEWIKAEEVEELERRMRDIVKSDMAFIRKEYPTQKVVDLFKKSGMEDKARLFETRTTEKSSIYMLGDTINYFYGYLAPSTGVLTKFKLTYYNRGIILLLPDMKDPTQLPAFNDSPKFFNIITENNRWLDILGLDNCAKLNEAIRSGKEREIILVAESLHEKKLAMLADEIYRRKRVLKIISIAGPSSSGKTTTAKRLSNQLRVNGFKPFLISLDDYFVDRDDTPLDADGKNDFECLEAINVPLFNQHLNTLMAGGEVEFPRYNFKTGKSEKSGKNFWLPENGIIIVEGIHGLNPNLYRDVPAHHIYKIYVSALTQLNIDHHNRIPTTDSRMLRRIVRDASFRNHNAQDTIARWPSVRRGEERNIFPFQEMADMMFNSSLVYEFSILKHNAMPLLQEISETAREYSEARRLIKFLSFFEEMNQDFVPFNSILREFIGKSIFDY